MTTDCPSSMCQIPQEIKYDYALAEDEQAASKAKDLVYKFDDQPMSAFQLDGHVYVDDFEFGYDFPVDDIRFIGINRAYNISGSNKESFPFKETISGILGLAPPETN